MIFICDLSRVSRFWRRCYSMTIIHSLWWVEIPKTNRSRFVEQIMIEKRDSPDKTCLHLRSARPIYSCHIHNHYESIKPYHMDRCSPPDDSHWGPPNRVPQGRIDIMKSLSQFPILKRSIFNILFRNKVSRRILSYLVLYTGHNIRFLENSKLRRQDQMALPNGRDSFTWG